MRTLFKQRQAGLSLVELMIAITLATLLMLGVTQAFLSSKITYSRNQELSEIQESGRFALDILVSDIANTAYQGQCYKADEDEFLDDDLYKTLCAINQDNENYINPICLPRKHITATTVSSNRSVWSRDEGALLGWVAGEGPSFVGAPADSEGFFVQFAVGSGASFNGAGKNKADSSSISWDTAGNQYSPLSNGDVALIADGSGCDLFLNDISGQTGDNNSIVKKDNIAWSSPYNNDFEILKFNSFAYYIGSDEGVPTLYRKEFDYNLKTIDVDALVPNVSAMKIEYGISTGAEVIDKYIKANDSDMKWEEVRSIRITLTIQAASGLKKDFSSLVILRNRL